MKRYKRCNNFDIIVFRKVHIFNIFWNSTYNNIKLFVLKVNLFSKSDFRRMIHHNIKITNKFTSFLYLYQPPPQKKTLHIFWQHWFRIIPNGYLINLCDIIKSHVYYNKPRLKYIFPQDIRTFVQQLLDKKVPKI